MNYHTMFMNQYIYLCKSKQLTQTVFAGIPLYTLSLLLLNGGLHVTQCMVIYVIQIYLFISA